MGGSRLGHHSSEDGSMGVFTAHVQIPHSEEHMLPCGFPKSQPQMLRT